MPLSALLTKKLDAPIAGDSDSNASDERSRLMAEFDITYNGRHYQFDGYRYDRLADALDYARLQRSRRPTEARALSTPVREVLVAPNESERELMAELGITYQDGVYHLRTYRYDRLVDAVNYARL